jgi:hypothetical protein
MRFSRKSSGMCPGDSAGCFEKLGGSHGSLLECVLGILLVVSKSWKLSAAELGPIFETRAIN